MASCPSLSDLLHLIWSSLGPSRKCSAFEKQLLIGWSGCVKSWAGGTPLLCGLTRDPGSLGLVPSPAFQSVGKGRRVWDTGYWGLGAQGMTWRCRHQFRPLLISRGWVTQPHPAARGGGWMEPPVLLVVICCCLVANLCPTLCDPMDCIRPGFLIINYLPEFAQTHVHWVCEAIQPSHPLLPLLFLPRLSQHQGLFQGVSSSH